ncbi:MAG: PD-(D/E)XK nuclease family protein [Lachnospiraceae bacterium]|nr:PD-(D/E)XK nuclease family protein [Lachnospiraceae bacterium]
MSLQILIGDTNSGKSHTLVQHMVKHATAQPDERFFVIVPEQATLKMQKDVVKLHPAHAAMNIDVVSFDRLAHVVFSELGIDDSHVLDDIGKMLILRKVLKELQDDLTVYKNKIHLTGFAEEIKSVITELKQYGMDDDQLFLMQESAQEKGNLLLFHKLGDIRLVLRKFNETIKGQYQAAEEVLDLFAKVAQQSGKIKDSHIYLDGFTGFTPIQYRLLTSMLKAAKDVNISLTLPEDKIDANIKEIDLFYLSNQTYFRLKECARAAQTEILPDIVVVDENITAPQIFSYQAANANEEVLFTAKEILRLVREEGYRFRDIAVITGDVEGYYIPVREVFDEADISVFIDYKSSVTEDVLARFFMGALRLVEERFAYDAVFGFLKTHLTDLKPDEVGLLENYCLEFGIRGNRAFSNPFTKNNDDHDLEQINQIRQMFYDGIRDFYFRASAADLKARDFQTLLLSLCERYHLQEQMAEIARGLNEEGLLAEAKEYEQIYKLLIELLEQITLLLGEAPVTVSEYREVLENALQEVKIGIIPPSLDAVTFGDLTRTRLDKIRALFFIGVNDGKIPKASSNTGLFTQRERALLRENFEIAPTVEEDLYTQQFYLYLMLHKPQDLLYLTYASYSSSGDQLRPSYVLEDLADLFGTPVEIQPASLPSVNWKQDALRDLAGKMRSFAEKEETIDPDTQNLLSYFAKADPAAVRTIVDGAFFTNKQTALDAQVAKDLYGDVLRGSVSRYESFNECAFKHFLNYGLRIQKRPEYQVEAADMGTLYHAALEKYGQKLQEEQTSFREISDEDNIRITNACVDEALEDMKNDVLFSSKRYEFLTERIRQVTQKTTDVLRAQVKAGLFEPDAFEYSFGEDIGNDVRFTGKIDRIDLYDAEDIFVRIIDYKSGAKKFNVQDIYSGLQLQLVAYLSAAMEKVKEDNPDKTVRPGGVYYYLINDRFTDDTENGEDKFRMSGLTSCEEGMIEAADQTLSPDNKKSHIVNVTLTNSGYSKNSQIANDAEFEHLLRFVRDKITDVSQKIKDGCVDIEPFYRSNADNGCRYCDFKDICRFEAGRYGTDWKEKNEMTTADCERELYGRAPSE